MSIVCRPVYPYQKWGHPHPGDTQTSRTQPQLHPAPIPAHHVYIRSYLDKVEIVPNLFDILMGFILGTGTSRLLDRPRVLILGPQCSRIWLEPHALPAQYRYFSHITHVI
jgi:hypothetical protein